MPCTPGWLRRAIRLYVAALLLCTQRPALADDALSVILGAHTPALMNTLNIVAEAAGFYRDEHLVVSKILVDGALEAARMCSSGAGDICPIGIEPLLTNYGDGIRLKMFLSRASKFSYVIAVPEDSPIRNLADFRGKNIGVHVLTAAASGAFTTQSALSVAGLKPGDYTLVPIGYENQAADAIASGKVAGAAFPYYEFIPLMVSGRRLRIFYHPLFRDVPNAGYAASPAVMAAKGAALKRFARSIVKASLLIRYNAAAAARLMLTASGAPFTDEDLRRTTAELDAWQSNLPAADPANRHIGALSVAGMQRYIQLLADAGVTPHAIPATEVVTEEYVAAANDFDHAALRRYAATLH